MFYKTDYDVMELCLIETGVSLLKNFIPLPADKASE